VRAGRAFWHIDTRPSRAVWQPTSVSGHPPGTEFTSNAMLAWAQSSRVASHFIAPGKPMENKICEAFNSPNELLNETIIYGLDQARAALARCAASAFGARLSLPRGICGNLHPNRRSAAQSQPSPPITCCSAGARAPISIPRL
jgi:transposase InsO family protein